jgi:tetratricopeptide (TPR) repeat protein
VKTSDIYCQNCRTANNLNETHCRECGTRLLLVIFPNSLQYDTNHVPTFYEDHLLERITLLELRVSQLTEQLESAFEFIQRGFESFKKDQLLLQTFLATVKELNPELAETLTKKSRKKIGEVKSKRTKEAKENKDLNEILAEHKNPNAELFTHLIKEGMLLLAEKEEKTAFQMLDRAALLSPENAALHLFIAENLFCADKLSEAKKQLEKIFDKAQNNEKVSFLLGAICADSGEIEKAGKLLERIAGDENKFRFVDVIKGMLAAFEGNWTKSVEFFKKAAEKNDSPEIQYLIGSAYFEMEKFDEASRFLQKALKLDAEYADAVLARNLIRERESAEEGKNSVSNSEKKIKETKVPKIEILKAKKMSGSKNAPAFAHFNNKEKGILTGGELRLAKFFRENILRAIKKQAR